jgi:ATP-dependent Clp endopeptidase proteolytic subunit ClpP
MTNPWTAKMRDRSFPRPTFSARTLLAYAAAGLPEIFSAVAASRNCPAEILLYDVIGFEGITAPAFAKALAEAGDGPITLRINSPGGDVFEGFSIYNMLCARSAPVNVIIDGLAASAASFIAMAGRTISMGEPSMLMIHNAWGLCLGDRNDMRETAAMQGKIDGQVAAIYAARSGKPASEMAAAMNAETWYTATEAKKAGLCDVVLAAAAAAKNHSARLQRLALAERAFHRGSSA